MRFVLLLTYTSLCLSVFSDIFDEEHFVKSLRRDVKIIKKLPKEVESLPRARKHFTSWSGVGYYEEMTNLWKEYKVLSNFSLKIASAVLFICSVTHFVALYL